MQWGASRVSLQQRCLNEFLPHDREQGASYFNRRRVSLGARRADGITATVAGSGDAAYDVRLDWTHAETYGRLGVECSCPRFAGTHLCKHVWATIVAVDGAQLAESVPGRGRLQLDRVVEEPEPGGIGPDPDEDVTGDPLPKFLTSEETARLPAWRQRLLSVRSELDRDRIYGRTMARGESPEVLYRINVARCFEFNELVVDLYQRKVTADGKARAPRKLNLQQISPERFRDAADRDLLRLLKANPTSDFDPYVARFRSSYAQTRGTVPAMLYDTVLPQMCATGRLGWVADHRVDPATATTLSWDGGEAWRFVLELSPGRGGTVRVRGLLRRGGVSESLAGPLLLLANGAVLWRERIGRLAAGEDFPWITELRGEGDIVVPEAELDTLLEDLSGLRGLPELEMPPAWRWSEVRPAPRPRLSLRPIVRGRASLLGGDVSFDYDGCRVPARRYRSKVFDRARRRVVHRDLEAELASREQLRALGLRSTLGYPSSGLDVELTEQALVDAVGPLFEAGWTVEAEGRRLRSAAGVDLSLAAAMKPAGGQAIDWFELRGEVRFEDPEGDEPLAIELPRLLAAVSSGERWIRLGDGSEGMLPEAWLERFGPLARLRHGDSSDAVRYLPSQATLLDALLAAEPSVDIDRTFTRLRNRLHSFERLEPSPEPRGFRGELRAYQREGLGWLRFLQQMGLGGCLADDMGLGKTVQVLALLQARRLQRTRDSRTSLVVVPRSVVHNWRLEAARFTPRLAVVDYSGPRRKRRLPEIREGRWNLVVTTYGILRRDVVELKEVEFDYVVLDEAQAIKNASSLGAKASRLLRAEYRLALTGTPVENHLGELWSIFEFLNPGMLGGLPAFKALFASSAKAGRTRKIPTIDRRKESLSALAAALKPFILRRTKDQVLDDLPEKTEQTLYCDLGTGQWQLYRELRDHYRAALDRRIEADGLARSKIHVLEALLRLRQAACHPGLVDPDRNRHKSAKLETLLEQVDEVLEEGHKALVFSQFVSLLEMVRERLDRRKITYEYLDGRTRGRQRHIDRFQNDEDCRLFLISLKAGGLGLNLTAASYVFILDPWWNPAVEAQAVDRAHRIGQTRPVFAYRLIARGTVEEKILELQESKRELADAILSASGSMIQDLTAEDLRLLLS